MQRMSFVLQIQKKCKTRYYFKKNKDIGVFSNNKELIKVILQLKESKRFANKLSKNSLNTVKNTFGPSKIYLKYQKIIK